MIRNIIEPDASVALEFINSNHKKNPEKTFLLILGSCIINYHGRAKSFLDWGERIIMIKQDGNVIVHQPTLRDPVNWQPAGSITEFFLQNNHLILKSRHKNPPEKMNIEFKSIKNVLVSCLNDNAVLKISGMESDVVNQIVKNPECIEPGLRIKKREKQVKSGMIDLYGFDKDHNPVIIEVKRSLATISAVHQLRMYVNDLKHDNEKANVRGILCAPRIPDMIKHLLNDYNLEWQEIVREIVLHDDWQKKIDEYL